MGYAFNICITFYCNNNLTIAEAACRVKNIFTESATLSSVTLLSLQLFNALPEELLFSKVGQRVNTKKGVYKDATLMQTDCCNGRAPGSISNSRNDPKDRWPALDHANISVAKQMATKNEVSLLDVSRLGLGRGWHFGERAGPPLDEVFFLQNSLFVLT